MLIAHLPQESWTQTALRDSPEHAEMRAAARNEPVKFGPWALANYQFADLIDAVRHNTFITAVAGNVEPKPQFPQPTPRPGAQPEKVRALTPEGLTYLQRIHGRKET